MDLEWQHQEALQDQDNYDATTGEDDTRGSAGRGRSTHTIAHKASGRAGSADAGSRQATYRQPTGYKRRDKYRRRDGYRRSMCVWRNSRS